MIKIKEIAFTGYPVTDIARARSFYEGVLGLSVALKFDHEGRAWIEYELGSGTLAITNMSMEQWRPSAQGPSVALEVEDFEKAVEHLCREAVRFQSEPMDTGPCQLAIIMDPDGNSLAIHRRKAQS